MMIAGITIDRSVSDVVKRNSRQYSCRIMLGLRLFIELLEDCHIASTIGITRLNVNGDAIWASNVDTPKSAWVDLKKSTLDPKRDEDILERSVVARYAVRHDMKKSRNRMRYYEFKSQASLYEGIDCSMANMSLGDSKTSSTNISEMSMRVGNHMALD